MHNPDKNEFRVTKVFDREMKRTRHVHKTYRQIKAEVLGCYMCGKLPVYEHPTRGTDPLLAFKSDFNSPFWGKPLSNMAVAKVEEASKYGKWYCLICMAIATRQMRLQAMTDDDRKKEAMREPKYKLVKDEKFKRGKCKKCGLVVTLENYTAFHFDHVDQDEKDPRWRSMIEMVEKNATDEEIIGEMAKCNLLDRQCHHIKTVLEGDGTYRGLRASQRELVSSESGIKFYKKKESTNDVANRN